MAPGAALLVLVLGGCAEPPPLPPDVTSTIVIGRTTLAELTLALGEPASRVTATSGTSVTWRHVDPATFGADHERRLVVEIAPSGVVRSFDYQSNVPGEVP